MTLDEAINKNIKMAELQERLLSNANDSLKEIAMKFAAEYRQLAEWLMKLKKLSLQIEAPRLGSIEEYHYELAKCKTAFWSCNKSCMDAQEQYRRKADELRKAQEQIVEYKRLLKTAVEDMYNSVNDVHCKYCSKWHTDQCQGTSHLDCYIENKFKWRYADEALALLGKDIDVPASADDTNVGGKIDSWISVKDRLPKENILVLCYARSTTGEGNSCFLGAIVHGEFWFLQVNDIGHVSFPVLHWEVTHWQPLPEPPKDGEQNG